ncbi:Spy/CpxP family protein refolding chaperone [Parvibaculum sp.]|uniref:Spy/CpxP family protein refolding chaperone n=1 Tax=Parvibaculum sp. TaxID=2024848 RepID=UPI00320F24FC
MRNKLLTGGAAALLCVGLFAMPSYAEDTKPPRPAAAEMQKFAKDRCAERSARVAGGLAYLEARLKPSAAQLPLWNKWRDATLANAKATEQACFERPLPPSGKDGAPTIVERRAFMQKMLTLKLDSMKASQPALEALYQSLDADQKEILNRFGDFEMRPPFGHGPRAEHRGMLKGGSRMMKDDEAPDGPDAPPPAE